MSAFGGKADIGGSGLLRRKLTMSSVANPCCRPRCKADQKRQSRWRGCMPTALPSSTGRAAPRTASAELSNREIIPNSRSDQIGAYGYAPPRQKERPYIKQIKICDSSTLHLSGLPNFISQRGQCRQQSRPRPFVLKQKVVSQTPHDQKLPSGYAPDSA
jgi:hypothetical protein